MLEPLTSGPAQSAMFVRTNGISEPPPNRQKPLAEMGCRNKLWDSDKLKLL